MLELRYGLDGRTPATLDHVGRAFGVTRERIRQIEKNSLQKLSTLAELSTHAELKASARLPDLLCRTAARNNRDI